MSVMEQDLLITKLRRQDREAVKLVYELFYKDMFRIVYSLTRNYELAEDACHEAFVKLLERVDELRDVAKVRPWLIRVALNEAWHMLRDQKRLSPTDTNHLNLSSASHNGPEETAVRNDENQIIWSLVQRLPLQHRSIIVMRYTLAMGIEEISAILEIPAGTVKSRLSRALETLRRRWRRSCSPQAEEVEGVPGVKAR